MLPHFCVWPFPVLSVATFVRPCIATCTWAVQRASLLLENDWPYLSDCCPPHLLPSFIECATTRSAPHIFPCIPVTPAFPAVLFDIALQFRRVRLLISFAFVFSSLWHVIFMATLAHTDDSVDRAGAPFWHLLFTCMALPCCRCLRHTNSHPNSHSLLLATQLPCLTFLGAYLHLPRASYLAACVCSFPNFGLKCLTFNCSFFSLVCFVALRLRRPTYTRIWPPATITYATLLTASFATFG